MLSSNDTRREWKTYEQVKDMYKSAEVARSICESREAAGLARDNPECPDMKEGRQYKA